MRTPDEMMRSVIGWFALHDAKPGYGVPLWSVVGSATGHGSTVSCEICNRYGINPHTLVREPVFIDASRETVIQQCAECGKVLMDCDECCCVI